MAFSYWSIQGSGYQTVYYGLFVLLLGLPVYVWLKRDRGEYGESGGVRLAVEPDAVRAAETVLTAKRLSRGLRASRTGGFRKSPVDHHD
jgi:APA family basic amino acid/polyamine antiporter